MVTPFAVRHNRSTAAWPDISAPPRSAPPRSVPPLVAAALIAAVFRAARSVPRAPQVGALLLQLHDLADQL